MTRAVITGGAGFIASHLADSLIFEMNTEVVAIDRLPWRSATNIQHLAREPRFSYIESDLSAEVPLSAFEGADIVYHLAANSDVRRGCSEPSVDVRDTFLTTRCVLEAVRCKDIERLFFSFSSTVYGNVNGLLQEDCLACRPISSYGAMKLASEALTSSYSNLFGIDVLVFRLPNVVGSRMTHGVIPDFISKLKKNPKKLEILGDGRQQKQYLHVSDLIAGILRFTSREYTGLNVYNISADSSTNVDEIARMVCEEMGVPDAELTHTGGRSGWIGDVPKFEFDTSKARAAGWSYTLSSSEAVRTAIREILSNAYAVEEKIVF